MDYCLSIIIPTRNRQYYCKRAIEQVLNATSDAVQIVIQDNSNTRELEAFCNSLQNERIIYNYHEGVISFVDNFSEALSLAQGKYLCMIGDDDGVLGNIEKITKYASDNALDAFVPGLNAMYSWPSDNPFTPHAENGYLYITPMNFKICDLEISNAMNRLLNQAFQDYQETWIPRLYHGLVRKDIAEEVKTNTGHYFGGLTPDMYMSVSLMLLCRKIQYANFPITISGMCPGSGSANSATGAHTGELKDAPHFIGHDRYTWNQHIPDFYSVETIWAETGIQALIEFNRNDLVESVNLAYLLAVCSEKYPQFEEKIFEHAKKNSIDLALLDDLKNQNVIDRKKRRLKRLITGYRFRSTRLFGVQNIFDAEKIINRKLKTN